MAGYSAQGGDDNGQTPQTTTVTVEAGGIRGSNFPMEPSNTRTLLTGGAVALALGVVVLVVLLHRKG